MEEIYSETVTLSSSETPPVLTDPPVPKTIGSGIVTSLLGKGGAAFIYEIWNPKLEIHRAVKLWRPTLSEKIIQRFETEMKVTAKLRHPNIVEIHGVGEWRGLPFIEIEKIDGLSLKDLLKQKTGALPVPVAAAIGIFVCRALTYAHNQEYSLKGKMFKGVIHCDIKPANIMISKDGAVKLTDFGIALPTNTSGNAVKDKVTGSIQYMSPEQLASRTVDVRTDIFSLGVVLYEMFSGTKVFNAKSIETMVERRKKHDITSLSSFCKKLSPKVTTVVHQCINLEPDDRYQTANELMQKLERIYYKYSSDTPDAMIKRYLENDVIPTSRHNNIFALLPAKIVSGIVIGAILTVSFLMFGKKANKTTVINNILTIKDTVTVKAPIKGVEDVKMVVVPSQKTDSQEVLTPLEKVVKTTPKKVVPNKKTSVQKSSTPIVNIETEEALSTSPPIIENKTDKLVSSSDILDKLWKLVRSSDYRGADQMFRDFPVNDAEFFLAYAEYQIKSGNYAQAQEHALKALQTQSLRMGLDEVRSQCFYLKAKALGGEYDRAPDGAKGQAAMEAWYDVKFQSRSSKSNPLYISADKEIRRISAQVQEKIE